MLFLEWYPYIYPWKVNKTIIWKGTVVRITIESRQWCISLYFCSLESYFTPKQVKFSVFDQFNVVTELSVSFIRWSCIVLFLNDPEKTIIGADAKTDCSKMTLVGSDDQLSY